MALVLWPVAVVEVSKALWPAPCPLIGRLTWVFINAMGRVFATHACFPALAILFLGIACLVKG